MKHTLILMILLFSVCSNVKSQNNDKTIISKNVLYADAGTLLIISSISANYERHFYTSNSHKLHLYTRIGVGNAGGAWLETGWGGLGGLTMIIGKNKHYFEASGGAFLGYSSSSFVYPLLDLGYRYQKNEKGFVFRVKAGVLGAGIGLGYSF